jgi:hypothetical protein
VTDVKFAYAFAAVDVADQASSLSDPVYEKRVFVPLELGLMTEINRVLFMKEKINTVSWSHNLLNEPLANMEYKIYRKAIDDEGLMVLIHTASGSSSSYMDRGLSVSEKYMYSVTTADNEGHETSKWKTVVQEEED